MTEGGVVVLAAAVLIALAALLVARWRQAALRRKAGQAFPTAWREVLMKRVRAYAQYDLRQKEVFERRIMLFLFTKKIHGVDTAMDDEVRLLVAASAIIPVMAFPAYNYPNVKEVLLYANSFDAQFQTGRYAGHREQIAGMVGDRFMNGTVILSKADLLAAFDGKPHSGNVGIHEFVHTLDKMDGAIDGIPEILLEHRYAGPWLHEMKRELQRMEKGHSDINPYALTSNAEFLAVVSEYFFAAPEKLRKGHPELYRLLSAAYGPKPQE